MCSFRKLHLLDLADHFAPLAVGTCARMPADRALQQDAPKRECNYFPSDARRKLDERSLPALNIPQQRLSEVPLLVYVGFIVANVRADARRKNVPTVYISLERTRGDTARLEQWGFDCATARRPAASTGEDFITDTGKWDWHRTMAIILRCAATNGRM